MEENIDIKINLVTGHIVIKSQVTIEDLLRLKRIIPDIEKYSLGGGQVLNNRSKHENRDK